MGNGRGRGLPVRNVRQAFTRRIRQDQKNEEPGARTEKSVVRKSRAGILNQRNDQLAQQRSGFVKSILPRVQQR